MNRIVREHYPVEKLPDDLRSALPEGGLVTIQIEAEAPPTSEAMTLEQIFALVSRVPKRTADEIDADLDAQRDEWHERG